MLFVILVWQEPSHTRRQKQMAQKGILCIFREFAPLCLLVGTHGVHNSLGKILSHGLGFSRGHEGTGCFVIVIVQFLPITTKFAERGLTRFQDCVYQILYGTRNGIDHGHWIRTRANIISWIVRLWWSVYIELARVRTGERVLTRHLYQTLLTQTFFFVHAQTCLFLYCGCHCLSEWKLLCSVRLI